MRWTARDGLTMANAGFDTKLDKEKTARRESGTTSLTKTIARALSPMQVKRAVKTDARSFVMSSSALHVEYFPQTPVPFTNSVSIGNYHGM